MNNKHIIRFYESFFTAFFQFKLSKLQFVSYPSHLPLFCKHDDDSWVVLPQHPPEVFDGFIEGTLRGDVGTAVPIAVDVTSVDVVTTFDSWTKHLRLNISNKNNNITISKLGNASLKTLWFKILLLDYYKIMNHVFYKFRM